MQFLHCLCTDNWSKYSSALSGAVNDYTFVLVLSIKGIFHPKMENLSSFTHPQVVPNLYECIVLLNRKEDILKNVGDRAVLGAPLTFIVFFSYYGVNGAPELLCLPHSSEYLPLCSAEQRHLYSLELLEGWVSNDRIFIFGVNDPFN